MAETIGSLVDKIAIIELKRFHMEEQIHRQDAPSSHIEACRQRSAILTLQRDDLVAELDQLFQDILSGKKQLKMYRQFKMYNDPSYVKRKT
jgi:hypothetical protein